jgi:hypothetical protein
VALESCVQAVIEALGVHLKAGMPSLEQVLYEFPAANLLLKYPSLSITIGEPQFMATDPYLLSSGDIVNNKALVKRIVGQYDFQLQLDLWCRSKPERFKMYEEFFSAFNAEIIPMGLSLQLSKYHGVWCRYDMIGYIPVEDEAASQRGEWRARINLLANTRAVREKSEFIIDTIENNLTTPNTIE